MSLPPDRFLEVSRETAALLRRMDGTRDLEALARDVSADTGREVGARDVADALERTLGPLGAVEGVPAPPPLEGGAARAGFALPPARVRALVAPLAALHAPALGIPLAAASLALQALALRSLPALLARERVLLDPALLVALAALLPVLAFHELGHASALARRGGTPGRIGVRRRGPWVTFYADVADAAKLPRAGRLAVDAGGIHFQWLACGALAALHVATGSVTALAALLVAQLNLVLNLSPSPGADGHWLLSDALGVRALGLRTFRMLARPPGRPALPPVPPAPALLWCAAQALHLGLVAAFTFGWLLPRLAREWSLPR